MSMHPKSGDRVMALEELATEYFDDRGNVTDRVVDAPADTLGTVVEWSPGSHPMVRWDATGTTTEAEIGVDCVLVIP